MNKFDSDRDGRINFLEFIHLMIVNINESSDFNQNVIETFEKFDKDGNGFITRSELKEAMRKLDKKITNEEIDFMLQEADTNMDGKIDFAGNAKINLIYKPAYFFILFFKNL